MRPPQPSRARFNLPLALSPANAREGTKCGSAQAPTPAAPRVFKSERRVNLRLLVHVCWSSSRQERVEQRNGRKRRGTPIPRTPRDL